MIATVDRARNARTVVRLAIARHEAEIAEYDPPPRVRADCLDGGGNAQRPCPWARCRYHLAHGSIRHDGHVDIRDPADMTETCALDVADRGGVTLREVGELIDITRERVRQVEALALLAMLIGMRRLDGRTLVSDTMLRAAIEALSPHTVKHMPYKRGRALAAVAR